MKKFIQIFLVVILVLVLVQAATGGSLVSVGHVDSRVISGLSHVANVSAEHAQIAVCLETFSPETVSRVICVMPNVGWNS